MTEETAKQFVERMRKAWRSLPSPEDYYRLCTLALRGAEAQWRPTHQHVKRGTKYQQIGIAILQTDKEIGENEELIVYSGEDGGLWARPASEFSDGRFIPLTALGSPKHILYKTGDADAPRDILDSNGEVVLSCCRVCGWGEIELDEQPYCAGSPKDE